MSEKIRKRTPKSPQPEVAKPHDEGQSESEVPKRSLTRRIGTRIVFIAIALSCAHLYAKYNNRLITLADVNSTHARLIYDVSCSDDYKEDKKMFPKCAPTRCVRVIMDNVITQEDAKALRKLAQAGLALGGSSGGASILDLHSGALSKGERFINIYKRVKNRIHSTIATEFGIPKDALLLTSPTFFSQMTTKPSKTVHDEYWHLHVDKKTYGSFDYTSLLYLSDYETDFTGGRFVFVDESTNSTVEPKTGRLSFFTSGSENVHHVERMRSGTRYAITVSFTCDPAKAIKDPSARTPKA